MTLIFPHILIKISVTEIDNIPFSYFINRKNKNLNQVFVFGHVQIRLNTNQQTNYLRQKAIIKNQQSVLFYLFIFNNSNTSNSNLLVFLLNVSIKVLSFLHSINKYPMLVNLLLLNLLIRFSLYIKSIYPFYVCNQPFKFLKNQNKCPN